EFGGDHRQRCHDRIRNKQIAAVSALPHRAWFIGKNRGRFRGSRAGVRGFGGTRFDWSLAKQGERPARTPVKSYTHAGASRADGFVQQSTVLPVTHVVL